MIVSALCPQFRVLYRAGASAGLTDDETLHAVFAERGNRYLARQLCWVLVIGGLETYLLIPRDPSDIELLIEAIRPRPRPGDLDVVIGVRGPDQRKGSLRWKGTRQEAWQPARGRRAWRCWWTS